MKSKEQVENEREFVRLAKEIQNIREILTENYYNVDRLTRETGRGEGVRSSTAPASRFRKLLSVALESGSSSGVSRSESGGGFV
jgi:hypothetical protein